MFVHKFKILVAASALASAVAGPASGADVSVEGRDWTGLYIGGYFAGGLGLTEADFGNMHPKGIFGGADIGFQYQFDSLIVGVEGNASFSDLDDDQGTPSTPTFQTQDMDNIGSVRAKIGTPVGDRMMLFATAGWGWGKTEYGEGLVQQTKKVSGPALGVGAHYALTDHFIGRAEYVHYFYGDTTYNLATPTTVTNSANELRVGLDYMF